jgi:hypothetical protein
MEEMESAPGKTEPRWKMAGPPYLLTRDELLQELRSSGHALSDRRLRDWATDHIIPRPRRRVPAQAPDRVPRVLYPSFMVAVIKDLLDAESTSQTTREELRQMAPQRIQYWQARYGDDPEVKEIPPSASTFSGGATIPIPISAGTLVSAPPGSTLSGTGTVPAPTSTGRLTAAAPVGPAPAQRLRLAVWGHAARVAERNAIRVTEATLMLKTEDGTVITIPIHPVPAPRKTTN